MKRPRSKAVLGALVCLTLWATVPRADASLLARRLDAILDDSILASALVGAVVVGVPEATVLYSRNADKALIPASNMKLITSLAALHFLGPRFRYCTAVCSGCPPNPEGTIAGNVYLRGDGDPTLTHEHLDALAAAVAQRGVRRIQGDIVADPYCFSGPPLGQGWSWSDETYAYSAQICGLSVDGNAVRAEVVAGAAVGDRCSLVLDPPSDYLRLDVECVTGPPGTKVPGVYRRRARNVVATTAPVPVGERVSGRVTLEEPDLYAATLLRNCLTNRGIMVEGGCHREKTPQEAIVLATHQSPPLTDLLALMNVPSDNVIAEALLHTIPRSRSAPETATEAIRMIERWLPSIGVSNDALRLCDGSGLSRLNLVTPRAMVRLLRYAAKDEELGKYFIASLPVAGQSGTLAERMVGTCAAGRVRAKTGSLWGVSALSGYVMDGDECTLAFSLMMNNYRREGAEVRRLQDRACVVMVRHVNAYWCRPE